MMEMLSSNRRRLDGASDGGNKSPATLFWMILHWICCLISLLLGFRFSRLVMFLLFSSTSTNSSSITAISTSVTASPAKSAGNLAAANTTFASSRVAVGRHGIRIRPWPHPDPEELMRAHRILEEVQRAQRIQLKEPRSVIAITPTFVRTFQTPHLTGVMHFLMNCPYELVWIVVEAGGKTAETASLLEKSGLQTIHVGFQQKMPETWEDRRKMENQMRLLALRTVRSNKLDGIVIFADDSNIHSTELFDEIQKVKKIVALSVAILINDTVSGATSAGIGNRGDSDPVVMGPSCDESNSKSVVGLEWAGFALNSRLLWNGNRGTPEWIEDLEGMEGNGIENPLSLLKEHSGVEPLGDCGQRVLVWWVRVEARSDSGFPPGSV